MGLHVSSQCSIFMLSETLSNLWFSDAFSRDIESKNWLNMGSLYEKICLIYLSCILITAHRFLNPNLGGTHPNVVSENIPFSTKSLLILLMSAFFSKNQHFFPKIVPLLKAIV